MYCIFFIHSYGHLGYFHVLAIINSALVNIGVCVSFQIMVFSEYMPRNGIAESYGFSLFKVAAPVYIPSNSVGGLPVLL